MAVYYEVDPIECCDSPESKRKKSCRAQLVSVSKEKALSCQNAVVEVISPEQFDELDLLSEVSNDFLHSLVQSDSNYVDVYADHMFGSFSIPDKSNLLGTLNTFAFYANDHFLIFADDTGVAADTLKEIEDIGVIGGISTSHCLYVFMKQLLIGEVDYMAQIQMDMESLEEDILERHINVDTMTIMRYRRQSIKLTSYYEQTGTMAALIADNENQRLSKEEIKSFSNVSDFASRLASRGETLENYSLQLHELHQTRIDLAQNATMQTLTIVTVIISPLALLTGWFGMNIALPGLNWPYMWIVLSVLILVVVVALVVHFRRKRWL